MGAFRLRIPKNAELSGVEFQQTTEQDASKRKDADGAMESFDLLLRMPGAKVIAQSAATLLPEDRLGVTASHFDYRNNPDGPHQGISIMLRDPRPYGPFDKAARVFGLAHWHSVQFPKMFANSDLFWHEASRTYITCDGDTFATGEARGGLCVQYFNMAALQARISVSFDRKWLGSWAPMQSDVKRLIESYQLPRK